LGERAGQTLDIPFYMYEAAATKPAWRNLATIRAGEYEALPEKLAKAEWKPDYGPSKFNPKSGATVIGARDFLIAYNVNLNTTSVRRANSVAFDVREQGRIKRKGDPIDGPIMKDKQGNPLRIPGTCKAVKGIGWYIEEYGIAQISMNLTNINITPLHVAFEECCKSADKRGLRVTGSELVGLVPLQVMLDAGKYFLRKQERSVGLSEAEIIKIAVKSLGLDELGVFDPKKKIIEYQLEATNARPLLQMNLRGFADETASESMAPGGGSISAYVGALGASLATMVANLSSHKPGWDDQWEVFSNHAAEGQLIKDALLKMVDEDTHAFNAIIAAFRLPKGTTAEKAIRKEAVQAATRYAIEVPFQVMEWSLRSFELALAMVKAGNPNSITDAGVGALCARAAIYGAFMNVKINAGSLEDKKYVAKVLKDGKKIVDKADKLEKEVLRLVDAKVGG
jgi:glutamate formiminotransferase/formiminotetrahydrofolate cyclodeaminase